MPLNGNEAEGGNGGGKAGNDGDFSERLKRLQTQVDRKAHSGSPGSSLRSGSEGGVSPLAQAMRLSSEFVGGVVAGGALGWVFDYFLGTKPWGLMVFLVLGFVTGIYNVMRSSGFLGPTVGAKARKNGAEGP